MPTRKPRRDPNERFSIYPLTGEIGLGRLLGAEESPRDIEEREMLSALGADATPEDIDAAYVELERRWALLDASEGDLQDGEPEET